MSYNFKEIEAKWQKHWGENETFKAKNPKVPPLGGDLGEAFYVLDMFPYPSGAGLHVGHPLGYIASDIYARYKRHQGFNVLHPQGYDSFGLPAEQYAIQTGQHPAITTKTNIERYREQLDKIGFSFDWSREVRTSDPNYYKWTQWIFIQLFESWYDVAEGKAKPISALIESFAAEGNIRINVACDEEVAEFSAEDWKAFSEKEQEEILLKYRLTYLAETEVNWCPQLGTVLANDEIVNGVSERGGYPVVRKKMKQWSMRISAYAERLLQGLNDIDWTDSLKESQRNWIGKSVGAEVLFKVLPSGEDLGGNEFKSSKDVNSSHFQPFPEGREKATSHPQPFPEGRENTNASKHYSRLTGNPEISGELLNRAKEMRKNPTKAEALLWDKLKGKKIGFKFRRQHPIDNFIVDFVCLSRKLIVEVDGEIHNYQQEKDEQRDLILEEKLGYKVLHFKNEEMISNISSVLKRIESELENQPLYSEERKKVLPSGEDLGGDDSESHPRISVFTTRPDTIFGVTFMTLAPEHELVSKITTPEQKEAVEAYVEATAKRSERERMADVKTISGVFTGAYAEHPFTKEPVPIWIGDYVLASYGTGAVMAVPCGDQRDFDFAKHFEGKPGMPKIKNIFKDVDITEAAHTDKEGTVITNSDFLNDLPYKKALKRAIFELEKIGQGKGKTNYRLRDAVFSRQRYWGEPFPVYYVNGMPKMIDVTHLPIQLPEVEKYLPTEEGEPPLGRADVWAWDAKNNKVVPNAMLNQARPAGGLDSESHHSEIYPLELNTMPGWAGSSWYFFRYMENEKRDEVFASPEALNYWQNVDLYIGGSEHATGHLLYARFWTKFLKDRGLVPVEEPFKKLINQGMILGESAFVYRVEWFYIGANWGEVSEDDESEIPRKSEFPNLYISRALFSEMGRYVKNYKESNLKSVKAISKKIDELEEKLKIFERPGKTRISRSLSLAITPVHADVSLVNTSNELDIEGFKNWRPEFKDAQFILENGELYDANSSPSGRSGGAYIVGREVEKMSKSKYNVVNPDDICEDYGTDTLRMYEMFLGPLEQAKPWNTTGITGVHNFLKKLWKLYHSPSNSPKGGEQFFVTDAEPSKDSLKTLHKAIKKVTEDIENFSFNTSVSTFMICVNELTAQRCTSKAILEPLAVLISPYAPHIAEELWSKLGNKESVAFATYPKFEEKHLKESSKTYPVSFNGKMRFTMDLSLDLSKDELEEIVMNDERTKKQLGGATPKKVIIVPGKIINIVK